MKKVILCLILSTAVTTHAGLFDFFDFSKFFEAAITLAEGINENLEKVRLKQHEVMDIREQWDQTCQVTETLNPSLIAFRKLLSENEVNQTFCAPITNVLKLQSDILAKCKDYYSQPVPENAEYLVGKFTITILQSKLILTRCFPIVGKIKLPGLPGGN